MKKAFSLRKLALDVWLLEQLRHAEAPGLKLTDLQDKWRAHKPKGGSLSRQTLTRHRQEVYELFGVIIHTPDRLHYTIRNPEVLAFDTLCNDLMTSVQDYLFLEEFRDLGAQVQPAEIFSGREYLSTIGIALREKRKLKIRYRKFTDSEPYEAILHPYCLKASVGRWYLLARREGSEHVAQVYALDRTQRLDLLDASFEPDPAVDPALWFKDCFGVYRDFRQFPVTDLVVRCSPMVANYLRTLPLHDSQREIPSPDSSSRLFSFHISPSPDFLAELNKWGMEIILKDII